jgi:YD repeat-containing protein
LRYVPPIGRSTGPVDARCWPRTYTLDAFGRTTGQLHPDGTRVTYVYDAAGRMTTMGDATGLTSYTWGMWGRLFQRRSEVLDCRRQPVGTICRNHSMGTTGSDMREVDAGCGGDEGSDATHSALDPRVASVLEREGPNAGSVPTLMRVASPHSKRFHQRGSRNLIRPSPLWAT